jgi:hypothetical protein
MAAAARMGMRIRRISMVAAAEIRNSKFEIRTRCIAKHAG